ncbi:alpha/beta fold hydrolase [Sphingomonas cavernae]|uniref:Alpha/beta fold hydrolase n=2 Tax=Sphingomonas cavernae TaxID=2320861 RepID=A0A418W5J4_9SPHN|nr:alpha/beta fold hydrolase [Sphingomonas cavernae]
MRQTSKLLVVIVAASFLLGWRTQASSEEPVTSPQHAAQAIALKACSLPDIARAAQCGSISLPEHPGKPHARQIAVAVAILPARNGRALPDPIVVLMGGPGESAIDAAAVHDRRLGRLLDDRDLLLIDQRGTGRSAALPCELVPNGDVLPLLADIFPTTAVAQCVKNLRSQADLTQYGYPNFARDVEQVRRALGYGKLNLFGGSYGTRALQVYLREYPENVRTAYLGSVIPIDIATPATMAATADGELERLFAVCAENAACARAYPALRGEFASLLGRLDRGEVRVSLPGRPGRHVLHRGPVAAWVRSRLYRPSSAAELPWAIHRAYGGDWQPIVDGVLASAHPDLSFGSFFAITCNEDVRFLPQKRDQSGAAGFLGDYRVRQQQAACRSWPSSPLPSGYRQPVRSNVPSLFVTGENDGGSPVWFTDHAALGFSNGAVLLAPGQGHTEWSDCISRRYEALVESGEMAGLRRQACPAVPRPPFKIG